MLPVRILHSPTSVAQNGNGTVVVSNSRGVAAYSLGYVLEGILRSVGVCFINLLSDVSRLGFGSPCLDAANVAETKESIDLFTSFDLIAGNLSDPFKVFIGVLEVEL